MIDHITLSASEKRPETLSAKKFSALSNDRLALYGKVLDDLQNDARRLFKRDAITVRLATGSDIPIPPAKTTAGILKGLDAWISQHAQHIETFEVPFDTLNKPTAFPRLFDRLWRSV